MNNNIKKVLDLSTSHITSNTDALLDQAANFKSFLGDNNDIPLRVAGHEHGYIIFLTDKVPEIPAAPELEAVVKYAMENDCMFINFDSDAKEVDGLETFEW